MTKPRTWTPEDEEVLTRLYLGRQPLERIAKRFGVSKDAVKQKAHRMGLKRTRPKDAPKDDIATRLRVLPGEGVRPPTGSGYGRSSTCELGVTNIPGGVGL